MNQVSELSLALAVSRARGFPSISSYCYKSDNELIDVLNQFVSLSKSSNLILGIDEHLLLNNNVVTAIKDLKISHVLRYFNENPNTSVETKTQCRIITEHVLQTLPCQQIEMKQTFDKITDLTKIYFVKGSDAAGRTSATPTKELFDYHRKLTPNAKLVPTGGIGTAEQVKYYINSGAVAVGLGTYFAASVESVLSMPVKAAMVAANNSNLSLLDTTLKQQGLIFKKFDEFDNANHTTSLKIGIKSNADAGHIFAGHGINFINTIDDVKSIILKLTNLLK
tara:strand:- start:3734 stop:4573 length:840 start_codon:yes stop_codon:yes gene_type:complete